MNIPDDNRPFVITCPACGETAWFDECEQKYVCEECGVRIKKENSKEAMGE